jgi:Zn-finger nucleic acid-binding protein
MKCPVCTGVDLKMAERQGVEIDYCPECRGVWLDRGELDKIIERSDTQATAYLQAPPPPQYQQSGHNQQQYVKQQHHDDHGYGQNGYQKKKSWISELFD